MFNVGSSEASYNESMYSATKSLFLEERVVLY